MMQNREIKKGILTERNDLIRYLSYIVRSGFKKKFEKRLFLPHIFIQNKTPVYHFKQLHRPDLFRDFYIHAEDRNQNIPFEAVLRCSGTTAFLVIQDDTLLYEKYFNGFSRDSLFRLYSISKSFLSALVGLALQEGFIQDVHDPISKYLPELESQNFQKITVANLLQMDSGIRFRQGYTPWKDQIKSYFCTHCRQCIRRMRFDDLPGRSFHYHDYHSLILIRILENAVDQSLVSYFEKKLWQVLGMEFPAALYFDSRKSGMPKFESGLSCRAVDLAKFGRLFLNNGNWNGRQILNLSWIHESTIRDPNESAERYASDFLNPPLKHWFQSGIGYYRYHWWGQQINEDEFDYFALGIFGQFLYISPRRQCIVLRLGTEKGIRNWWPNVLKRLVDRI
jgi:CubicO group peptidase (beta-lactamase class C family)